MIHLNGTVSINDMSNNCVVISVTFSSVHVQIYILLYVDFRSVNKNFPTDILENLHEGVDERKSCVLEN
jgi:hypothetical protein